jgi:hypothetical protein
MNKPNIFVSACPACGQQRLQHAYPRRMLMKLLATRHTIDAYCVECDIVWPISAPERFAIAEAIASGHSDARPSCPAVRD